MVMTISTPIKEEEGESSKSLAITIQKDLDKLPKLWGSCIYKVPKRLREVNEKAYTPRSVSIGPFHYKNAELLPMEPHKLICLRSFLNESGIDLDHYLQLIKDKESQIRHSYAEPIPLSSDEFIRMVLVDSAFIIQLFKGEIPNMKQLKRVLLVNDLMLAENQLPFFILKDLYKEAFSNTSPDLYFTDTVCDFLDLEKSRIKVDSTTNEAACFHLLDMRRTYHFPTRDDLIAYQNVDGGTKLCYTATSLYEAGVKFRAGSASSNSSLLDIHFNKENGILTIPGMTFGDETESVLRNMMAFEQCFYYPFGKPTYLTHYLIFLDDLINSMEDVKLLVKAGVIHSFLGNEKKVSHIINSLCIQVYADSYIYQGISQQLNDHCNKSWNRHRATLKHIYFKHPWSVISVIAATILFLLTAVQVITGILAVPSDHK